MIAQVPRKKNGWSSCGVQRRRLRSLRSRTKVSGIRISVGGRGRERGRGIFPLVQVLVPVLCVAGKSCTALVGHVEDVTVAIAAACFGGPYWSRCKCAVAARMIAARLTPETRNCGNYSCSWWALFFAPCVLFSLSGSARSSASSTPRIPPPPPSISWSSAHRRAVHYIGGRIRGKWLRVCMRPLRK
ncbi:hypothetical protein DFH07DRAFT_828452 [Mycena maculata]|uniref:Uncharacterized protein n=1 Tax=Mycena maculata TaxID=230809 RepID=A0AAD7N7Y1_9AGAR|nr:hypothetical protein DFH07DRAFT_828452 [Mycena maculata]